MNETPNRTAFDNEIIINICWFCTIRWLFFPFTLNEELNGLPHRERGVGSMNSSWFRCQHSFINSLRWRYGWPHTQAVLKALDPHLSPWRVHSASLWNGCKKGGLVGAGSHLTMFFLYVPCFFLRMSEPRPPFHSWATLWMICWGVQTCHTVSNWPSPSLCTALLQTVKNWNRSGWKSSF